ncbi:MAG: glycosyltransferase family 9 protein [Chitinophagaceae bacterium]|nr:glycosyltransferase family 9 protein [Chitinophagaceae bacterium]
MQKFLIIQTAFIGDVVLATGIVEKVHQAYPHAHIDFLLRKGNEGLLANHPYLNEVLIWEKKKNKWSNLFKMLKKIRANKYDKVINLQRFASTGFLTAFSNAEEKIGFDKNPFSFLFSKKIKHSMLEGRHEVERNHDLVKDFTDNAFAKPKLYPTENDFVSMQAYTSQPYICIAPSSVWFTKQYPAEKWTSLINAIPVAYKIFLLGGKEDVALCETIRLSSANKNTEVLSGKLSFLQSAALMKNAVMNYVNDSAPLHFASAMNAPVTAIFCSTIPGFGFGPLSDTSFITETKVPLSCKPCTLHGRRECPLGHFKCALTIETEQLLNSIPALHE